MTEPDDTWSAERAGEEARRMLREREGNLTSLERQQLEAIAANPQFDDRMTLAIIAHGEDIPLAERERDDQALEKHETAEQAALAEERRLLGDLAMIRRDAEFLLTQDLGFPQEELDRLERICAAPTVEDASYLYACDDNGMPRFLFPPLVPVAEDDEDDGDD